MSEISRLVLVTLIAGAVGSFGLLAARHSRAQMPSSPSPAPSASPSPSGGAMANQTTQRQLFVAQINPVNGSGVSGTARIVVDGDVFGIDMQVSGLAPGTPHRQAIHAGTSCPDLTADTNGDGIVDVSEFQTVAGKGILPLVLGPTIGTAAGGAGAAGGPTTNYPIPAMDGAMDYINSLSATVVNQLFANVSPSPSPSASPSASASPGATPAPVSGATSPVDGHIIEIHGLAPATLPTTVQTAFGLPAYAATPSACGVITQVAE